jgi:hypothetical protein
MGIGVVRFGRWGLDVGCVAVVGVCRKRCCRFAQFGHMFDSDWFMKNWCSDVLFFYCNLQVCVCGNGFLRCRFGLRSAPNLCVKIGLLTCVFAGLIYSVCDFGLGFVPISRNLWLRRRISR